MVAALRLLDVSQRFGDTWVLAHVELTLGRGETLLLTGANGAGKTTLLRLMAGALRPTAGQVVYGEFTARAGPRAALLSHAHHLYEGLSASHNLQLVQRLLGRPTDVAAQLAAVGLGDVGEAPVVTFSAGMKRRLALARLQLLDAELQLLDEPFAGLDPDGVALMQRAVQNWQAAGRAVVVCTHDVARAENLCQRHLHLGGRRLQAPAPGGLHG